MTESKKECRQVGDSVYRQERGWVFLQRTRLCSEVPLPSWLGGEAAIMLTEGPVPYCTSVEAEPLAAAWFEAWEEIRISLLNTWGALGNLRTALAMPPPCNPPFFQAGIWPKSLPEPTSA